MKELEIAKKIIVEEIEKAGLKLVKIILFGSRARGDCSKDSDWDFYVVVDRDVSFPEKRKITAQIRRRLVMKEISSDIIIQSFSNVERRKNDVGYLTYYVLKEGVKVYE